MCNDNDNNIYIRIKLNEERLKVMTTTQNAGAANYGIEFISGHALYYLKFCSWMDGWINKKRSTLVKKNKIKRKKVVGTNPIYTLPNVWKPL